MRSPKDQERSRINPKRNETTDAESKSRVMTDTKSKSRLNHRKSCNELMRTNIINAKQKQPNRRTRFIVLISPDQAFECQVEI